MKNPYTERIIARVNKQTEKGIKKYGSGMQANPLNLSILEVLEYALEETADCMVYLEKVKEMLEEEKDRKEMISKSPQRGEKVSVGRSTGEAIDLSYLRHRTGLQHGK